MSAAMTSTPRPALIIAENLVEDHAEEGDLFRSEAGGELGGLSSAFVDGVTYSWPSSGLDSTKVEIEKPIARAISPQKRSNARGSCAGSCR